ncbi:MAG: hypothetical protein F6K39_20640 [Okeania sp. SIO3B3]|nr:hypothetical protein [Okeania sp. SIO3B3]
MAFTEKLGLKPRRGAGDFLVVFFEYICYNLAISRGRAVLDSCVDVEARVRLAYSEQQPVKRQPTEEAHAW